MIAHRNAANIRVDILVKSVRNFVSVSTFSFDLTLKEIILLQFNGLTPVLADKEQANKPDKLAEQILRTNGDAINATPSRIYQYLEALLAKLRNITKTRIINTYGSTETTISANMKDLTCAENISVGQCRRTLHWRSGRRQGLQQLARKDRRPLYRIQSD